jgi:hypothetical protein
VERRLLPNGIDQTYTQVGFEPLSLWRYRTRSPPTPASSRRVRGRCLLGMGVAAPVRAQGHGSLTLDIVELDARIASPEKFFRYEPRSSRLFIDDARHFLRRAPTSTTWCHDLLIGEVQPTRFFPGGIRGPEEAAQ